MSETVTRAVVRTGDCPYCHETKPLVRGWLTIEGSDGTEYQIPQFCCASCAEVLV